MIERERCGRIKEKLGGKGGGQEGGRGKVIIYIYLARTEILTRISHIHIIDQF